MKKIFQMIGLISLTCFSFFVTEKTTTVVNDMDDIMISIKENAYKYESKAIDATIIDDTIIPGVNSRKVNINKSYKLMKKNGYYNDKLLVYDYEKPKISLTDNMNKYIIKGNPSKKMVSLAFKVGIGEDITDILNIVNNYNLKVSFFVNFDWFTNNNELISNLISKGHSINLILDSINISDLEWVDTVLKKVNKQGNCFCYSEVETEDNLNLCMNYGNYTIRPIVISTNTPLVDIKKKIDLGSVLLLPINSTVKKELSTIIIYIKSKGYNISSIQENILE